MREDVTALGAPPGGRISDRNDSHARPRVAGERGESQAPGDWRAYYYLTTRGL
jgi:hypothetical protein